MKVILSPRAEKQLRKLAKIDQIAVAKKIRQIKDEQDKGKPEKLKGYKSIFRIRVGNYRIVYRTVRNEVYIVLMGHRKDIYELLRQLID